MQVKEQLPTYDPAARVEQLRQTVSATRLNTWLQCRLKFYFRYIAKIPKPPTASLHAGQVAHAVLQAWNKARWRGEPFVLEQLKSFFERDWTQRQEGQSINWEGAEEEERGSTWRTLEQYFQQSPIQPNERPEAVEVRVEADLSPHGLPRLIGIMDLVRAGGKIVDFKNTSKTPDAAQVLHQNEIQLSCYSVLYRDATGRFEGGVELHHLVRTKTPKIIVTQMPPMIERQKNRLFRLIESYLAGLEREDFVPSPGFQCAGCEYFHQCRAWGGTERRSCSATA